MAKSNNNGSGSGTGSGSGIGSQCTPHDPALVGGDACFEWGGAGPGWNPIIDNCWDCYVPDEPDTPGPFIGARVRTQCKRDSGSGSGSCTGSGSGSGY